MQSHRRTTGTTCTGSWRPASRNSAWLPGITVQHTMPPWQAQRSDQVGVHRPDGRVAWLASSFAGTMVAAGIPLLGGLATRARSAAKYAQFDRLIQWQPEWRSQHAGVRGAVGGRLPADGPTVAASRARTAVASGPGLRNLRRCGELLDKLAFYRRSPAAALRIAEQGAATYRREHLAEHRITMLRDWMLDGRLPDRFNPRHDLRLATSQAAGGQLDRGWRSTRLSRNNSGSNLVCRCWSRRNGRWHRSWTWRILCAPG